MGCEPSRWEGLLPTRGCKTHLVGRNPSNSRTTTNKQPQIALINGRLRQNP
ncbi:hypothetical protein PGTUg99_034025 [Puccinia graminis f. sp. tritici]|uniref:Uncharacterized protein n=1 Tax=Puccinia graminis f. sp. tritici TaxID=56615 RepID=A0A5B0S721_PUCGR|nr:hypothetical protein PGTUg99_034025 [Puccinia graminis f. sp. tritici]